MQRKFLFVITFVLLAVTIKSCGTTAAPALLLLLVSAVSVWLILSQKEKGIKRA